MTKTPTQLVVDYGERLWGPNWVQPFSRFADVNDRTLRRCKRAAEAGDDHSSSVGALIQLRDALFDAAEELEDALTDEMTPIH